jgi:hypothetical protein
MNWIHEAFKSYDLEIEGEPFIRLPCGCTIYIDKRENELARASRIRRHNEERHKPPYHRIRDRRY